MILGTQGKFVKKFKKILVSGAGLYYLCMRMNERSNGKKKMVKLSAVPHWRLKKLSVKRKVKLETLVDEAVFRFLKTER